jgi:DNA-directed RNA polymerase specialized sigma24 family protein
MDSTIPVDETELRTLWRKVYILAIQMLHNQDDAADATQDIAVKVIEKMNTFRGESSFETWVFRVARNHLLTAGTKHSANQSVFNSSPTTLPTSDPTIMNTTCQKVKCQFLPMKSKPVAHWPCCNACRLMNGWCI